MSVARIGDVGSGLGQAQEVRSRPRRMDPVIWVGLHDLSRTGVPIVLLRYLRAIPVTHRQNIHLIAIHGGPLASSLERLVRSITILEPSGRRSLAGAVVAGSRSLGPESGAVASGARVVRSILWRTRLTGLPRPDILLVHGAGAWPLVGSVSRDVRVVLHVHELETGLDRCIEPSEQPAAFDRASTVMVVSDAVAGLCRSRGALINRIAVVPGVIEHECELEPVAPDLDPCRKWVVGVGSPGWRKGTDRLAPIAHELARRVPEARVAWVGGGHTGQYGDWVGSRDPVMWFEEQTNPWLIAAGAAAIMIPSREDPLPLVALEAGQRGLAVVAMPTGGLPALLGDGCGLVVGRQRLADLADATERVLCSPTLATDMGAALRTRVTSHFTSTVVAPLWWDLVTSDS